MAYTVELDFGAGWVDYTSYLYGLNPVKRRRAVYNDLRPVISSCTFSLVNNTAVVNSFLTTSDAVPCRILKDTAAYFLGYIRPTHKATITSTYGLEALQLEAVDAWYRLDAKISATAVYNAATASDPTTKSASLLHQLFYGAGFADAELNFPAIGVTIPALTVTLGKETYRTIIEGILAELGYSAYVDESGIVQLYNLAEATITPSVTLSSGVGGNMADGYILDRREATFEAVDIEFNEVKTLSDARVFEDTTGATAGLACSISVPAGTYYPAGAASGQSVLASMAMDGNTILSAATVTSDITYTGDITVEDFTQVGNQISIRIYSATGGVLTRLRGNAGTVKVKGDLRRIVRENVANTLKRETVQLKYVADESSAQKLARIRAQRHLYGSYRWTITTTELTLTPGDYVTIDESAILGANTTARVVQVEDGTDIKSIKIECEGVAEYTTDTTETIPELTPEPVPSPGQLASIENIAATVSETYAPKYLGRYDHAHPSSYNSGDWWTVYDTDDDPIQRGVWYSNSGTPTRITTSSAMNLQAKLASAIGDIAWAEAQGTYGTSADYGIESVFQSLGAVSAFIETLAAKQAFIESLFTNQIEVPDDGRIRYYTGQGVQRRAVELADESVSWIDTPDTTPATKEQLRGRIGRLGVGDAVLMDGEFNANIECPWGAESVINAAISYSPAYIQLASGELRIAYRRTSDDYLVERVWSGTAWGGESVINAANSAAPAYIQLASGELRIAYRRESDDYLVERVWSSNAWGAESVINAANTYEPTYIQLASGELRIAYRRVSDEYIIERVWSGTAWGAESVINAANSTDPAYIQLASGELRIAYRRLSDNYLVERVWSSTAWGAESVINAAKSYEPTYIQLASGELRIAYRRVSDDYIVERVWSGTAWGAESVINAAISYSPAYIQLASGELRIAYTRAASDYYLVERTLQRYARLGAGIIESGGDDTTGYWEKWSNGTMHCYKKVASGSASSTSRKFSSTWPKEFSKLIHADATVLNRTTKGYYPLIDLYGTNETDIVGNFVEIDIRAYTGVLTVSFHGYGKWA